MTQSKGCEAEICFHLRFVAVPRRVNSLCPTLLLLFLLYCCCSCCCCCSSSSSPVYPTYLPAQFRGQHLRFHLCLARLLLRGHVRGRRQSIVSYRGGHSSLSCSANHAQLSPLEQDVLWEYTKLGNKIKRVSLALLAAIINVVRSQASPGTQLTRLTSPFSRSSGHWRRKWDWY